MTESERIALTSMDISAKKREQLKNLFPEVFMEDKIDFDQLKRVLGEWVESGKERFGLNWSGKSACTEIIKQPSVGTLKPVREESVNFDETENLFIEGDNLEVLKLLQRSYSGKVKMIYIDPPYNTGKEFIYPDKYGENLNTYLTYTGQIDGDGNKFSTNTDADGRYHTKWLNMMYPRLFLARNLLREDGVIFISIDDHEQANLRTLCDLVFGEGNFIGCILWNSTKSVTNTALISVSHTYNLVYAKSLDYFTKNRHHFRLPEDGGGFENKDNDPRGLWKADPFQVGGWRPNQQYEVVNPKTGKVYKPNPGCSWKNDHGTYQKLLEDDRIVFGHSGEAGPQRKRFLTDATERGRVSKTWWDEVGTTTDGTKQIKSLCDGKNVFSNPKPVDLIKKMIRLGDHTGDGIILDFFAGSSTTAQAVLELNSETGSNRKFIMVQLPENVNPNNKDQVGIVEFCREHNLPLNISALSQERIRLVVETIAEKNKHQLTLKCGSKAVLGFRAFKLACSNFKIWEGRVAKIKNLEKQLFNHIDHIVGDDIPEGILYELLLQAGLQLTVQVRKTLLVGKDVYSIDGGALLICLDRALDQAVIDAMAQTNAKQVICLDEGFEGNDQLKVNAVQTFKTRAREEESEIVFKTV